MSSCRIAIVALSLLATEAEAQASLRVRVESESRPLGGALVALVDSANRVVVEQLSSAEGRLTLDAPPGVYRVRVRRIGYRPFYSSPVTIPRAELELQVESPRVVLQQMIVSARDECGPINPDAQTLASLWEEISKALRASEITMTDLNRLDRYETYRREVNRDGGIVSSDSVIMPVARSRPFGAPNPEALVSLGYVRGNEFKGWDFFGPDETVLLSDGFASTHCFRATRDKSRAGQIGVTFRPAPRRKIADIRGVIWVDETTSELREVEFRFVNTGLLDKFDQGGFSRFRRMPSGAWLVDQWELRMPRLVRNPEMFNDAQASGYVATGGRIR